jgi:hypothetical protein
LFVFERMLRFSFFLSFSIVIRSNGMDVIFHTYNERRQVHVCINPLISSDNSNSVVKQRFSCSALQ